MQIEFFFTSFLSCCKNGVNISFFYVREVTKNNNNKIISTHMFKRSPSRSGTFFSLGQVHWYDFDIGREKLCGVALEFCFVTVSLCKFYGSPIFFLLSKSRKSRNSITHIVVFICIYFFYYLHTSIADLFLYFRNSEP